MNRREFFSIFGVAPLLKKREVPKKIPMVPFPISWVKGVVPGKWYRIHSSFYICFESPKEDSYYLEDIELKADDIGQTMLYSQGFEHEKL